MRRDQTNFIVSELGFFLALFLGAGSSDSSSISPRLS